jgi:hypothetical protein
VFNQEENFNRGIRKRKARIEEITLILSQPRPKGAAEGFLRKLIEERLHLQEVVAELEKERERLELQKADSLFRWEDIDQRLLTAKTNNLAEEMSRRVEEGKRRIAFETAQSGNSAGYASRWFSFQEQLTEERVERVYAAYCETWVQQNRTISPAFIRAVRDRALAETFAAVQSSVAHGVLDRARRIGEPHNSAAVEEWYRRMDRLRVRCNRKLEADAIAAEYHFARRSQYGSRDLLGPLTLTPEDSIPVSQSHTWRTFHDTFRALAEEELKREPNNKHDLWLRAYASYEDKTLETGLWTLGGGVDESFKERFAVAATRAGMALRPSATGKRLEAWLHYLFLGLLEHRSNLLFAGIRDEGGIIVRVCEASAVYCSRLEQEALDRESSINQAEHPTLSASGDTPKRSSSQKPGRIPTRPLNFVNSAGKLWLAAKRECRNGNVTATQLTHIASQLDEQQFVPPARYLEGNSARELKLFNSKNSNSKRGPIQTWSLLVTLGDKDHVRGMRRMLSRCAEKLSP